MESGLPDNNMTEMEYELSTHDFINDYESAGLDALYENLRSDLYPNIVILTALLASLFLVGTIGNILVVVVFARSFVKHNSTYLILTLAVVDLTINLVNIPGVLIKEWYYPFRSDVVCRLWELIQMGTIPISALILVAIAFDRYFLICKAFKGPIPIFWSKLFLCCAIVVGLALGIPPMLAMGVYQVKDMSLPPTNQNLHYIGLCEPNYILIKSETLHQYWIFLTVLFVLIIIILTTLYIFIFLKVYEQSKKWNTARSKLGKSNSNIRSDCQGRDRNIINFQGFSKLRCIFVRSGVEENCNEHKNSVYLVKVSPIEIQESSTCQKDCTDVENLTPELPNKHKLTHNTLTEDVAKIRNATENNNMPCKKEEKRKTQKGNLSDYREKSQHQKKAHIKTAYVLCIVTLIYIISYLPTFLITHNVINGNIFLFYFYFIHSASNPLIYSFMNVKFRNEIKRLFTKKKITI